jgi:hypothetical protein
MDANKELQQAHKALLASRWALRDGRAPSEYHPLVAKLLTP